jgi:universal stress protein A
MKNYHHLLLAIDIYEDDHFLLEEALKLAEHHHGKLTIMHVAPQLVSSVPYAYDFQAAVLEHARKALADLQAQYQFAADQVILREGRASDEIVKLAIEIKADMIICGSHGKHGFGLLLGSTANGVLHQSPVDVLTIRVDKTGKRLGVFPYQNIVLAIDLHGDNQPIIDVASDLATYFKADLHVIHVVGDVSALGYYPAIEIDLKSTAEGELAKLIQKSGLSVQPDHQHVKVGFPKQEILDLAAEVQAGLVVLGSHGRKALASAILGSTANAVLHGAQSDVMVVRV